MDSASFILERLNWPVRYARLRAARAYGQLLSDSSVAGGARQTYLEWLKRRRTENETCSGLAVLYGTAKDHLPSLAVLKQHITQPSALADFMLKEVYGPTASISGWMQQHSGEVPPSFEPALYFLRNLGSQIPPSLGDELANVEQRSGLPLTKQWAFEWNGITTALTAPFSGFPYHFIEPSLDRSGVSAQIDQRQGDVYRSAYLRTLHCAVDRWGMPIDFAYQLACKCLPLNRGLMDVEAGSRPDWLGDLPDHCADASAPLEPIIRQILATATASSDLIPVHLSTPLSLSVPEYSFLKVSCALLSDDFVPVPDSDLAGLNGYAWSLPAGSLFSGSARQLSAQESFRPSLQGRCLPLCVDVFPFPFGYWLGDLFQLGLSLPAAYAFAQPISYLSSRKGIAVDIGGQTVGQWAMWNDHWTPLYPKGGGPRRGSLSEMRAVDIRSAAASLGLRIGWTADVKVWTQGRNYDALKTQHRSIQFFDDGDIVRRF